MYITFKSNKRKFFESFKTLKAKYGDNRAGKIIQRLNEIESANNLKDLYTLRSAKCHALTGNLKGKYAVILTKNYRLIFEPVGDRNKNEEIDLEKVTCVKIIDVDDYHGK